MSPPPSIHFSHPFTRLQGTLSHWRPSRSVRSLAIEACDLSGLLESYPPYDDDDAAASAAAAADDDDDDDDDDDADDNSNGDRNGASGSQCNRPSGPFASITSLHLVFCLPHQIHPILPLFSSVTRLDITHSSLSDTALLQLLPRLPPRLLAIDLSHNPLSSHCISPLLSSTTTLQSFSFTRCQFSPSSSNDAIAAMRTHPCLTSVTCQVDGSASAVRLLHALCCRPAMTCIHVESPFTAASQHVVSHTSPPLHSLHTIVVINTPVATPWLRSVLSSLLPQHQHSADGLAPTQSTRAHSVDYTQANDIACARASSISGLGLRCLRLVNTGIHSIRLPLHCPRVAHICRPPPLGLTPDALSIVARAIAASPCLHTLQLDVGAAVHPAACAAVIEAARQCKDGSCIHLNV